MIAFALAVAGATLACGVVAGAGLHRLPTLRLQLAGLGLLAVFLPLAAVVLSGLVMFQSGHDLTILAVAAASSTSALVAALTLGRSIGRGVEPLQHAAAQMAAGDLSARAAEPRQQELAALATTFNKMAVRLEELFDTRTQIVAWASHDLRTPLANIQAMLEALEDGLAEPRRYLPALREQARTLGVLIDDLFELARIDAGALTLELHEAQLSGLVRSCLRGIEAEAQARSVQLEADVDDAVTVRCAPEKVERVLLNLLTNSLRHTPSDGSVAVRVERRPQEVQIAVEDTGDGLGPDAERMFERFWRGDPARTTSNGGGAGLGLAIARGLVEAHGGRIWAENRADGGARVCFTLPAPRA
ncbi:MAG: ATP-binding protein [Actinomycetota bacterium]|nr:ATP-binding protein [Actinomycetota bacterium]